MSDGAFGMSAFKLLEEFYRVVGFHLRTVNRDYWAIIQKFAEYKSVVVVGVAGFGRNYYRLRNYF